jgi:hypothetical protein
MEYLMNLSDLKKGQQLGLKKIIIRMSDLQNLLEKIREINYFSIFDNFSVIILNKL